MADFQSDAFRAEMNSSWSTAILYRWAGVPMAWMAARFGVTPLMVTLIALACSLALPVLAMIGAAPVFVLIFALLFQVLDCADGTLARVTGQTSRRGGDMDFLGDMIHWGMLYLAIGILADRQFDSGFGFTALAAIAAWARLLARVVRDRVGQNETPKTAMVSETSGAKLARYIGGISGLIPFLTITGTGLGVAVWALLIYGILDIIEGGLPLRHRT